MGAGKIESWDACCEDATRREALATIKWQFLQTLPPNEKARLDEFSSESRDDSKGEVPGSSRGDEEHSMFEATLRREDRDFLVAHRGLGNSQKAEVAWLEKRFEETGNAGYLYEELDVRSFSTAQSVL